MNSKTKRFAVAYAATLCCLAMFVGFVAFAPPVLLLSLIIISLAATALYAIAVVVWECLD